MSNQIQMLMIQLRAERALASQAWTILNELRLHGLLPEWAEALGAGTMHQADELSRARKEVNDSLVGLIPGLEQAAEDAAYLQLREVDSVSEGQGISTFAQSGGFTLYHYVQHADSPRYPYGLCGPFATEADAAEALERIAATFPAAALQIEQGGFAGDASQMLAKDNAAARQRLEQLRA